VLHEAVESYLRQAPCGEETELVIVSDCPHNRLTCDAPGVRVVQLAADIPDCATKFNASVQHARGQWIAWWEDDDISLPHRLRYSLERVQTLGLTFFKQDSAWQLRWGKMHHRANNLYFGSSFFRRALWDFVGGATPSRWADATAHDKMRDAAGNCYLCEEATDETAYFVYCWDGRGVHDSGHPGSAYERAHHFRVRVMADPRFRKGDCEIIPQWPIDYAAEVAALRGAQ
jgi:hypothetical protein